LRIAGTYAPPFTAATPEGDARLVQVIREAGQSVLFVAFGAPRQDRFIAAHLADIDAPIAMGVGCAFDILAGVVPRAPAWMQGVGLEWLWRLLQEPRRLWRRYLLEDIPVLLKLSVTAVRDGRAPVEP
jgi:N-acetylglucosaminyldiphosphoundecaprenol N-acetyl-beta-D-mannosaminyltransferase